MAPKLKGDSGAVRTRNSFLAHRSGLGLALVGAAEDVELAALLRRRLALIDVDAPQVDVDAARPPEEAESGKVRWEGRAHSGS